MMGHREQVSQKSWRSSYFTAFRSANREGIAYATNHQIHMKCQQVLRVCTTGPHNTWSVPCFTTSALPSKSTTPHHMPDSGKLPPVNASTKAQPPFASSSLFLPSFRSEPVDVPSSVERYGEVLVHQRPVMLFLLSCPSKACIKL